MTQLERLESDLGYVRQAVDRAQSGRSPAAIYVLWGVLVAAGFPLVDFAPDWVPLYWMIAGPAGWATSVALGWRQARARGQVDAGEGIRIALHWLIMMGAILLAAILPATGQLTGGGFAAVILLITALTYVLAGLHLERALLWIGLVMAGGYVAVLRLDAYAWTMVGVLVGGAMMGAAVLVGRGHAGKRAA